MNQMQSPPNATAIINNRTVDYFCGTGYYGFHGHPDILQAASEAMQQYGIGSATSRAGYGNNPVLLDVENTVAQFFETERAIHFVSGYMGNGILLQALSDDYDCIFMDAEAHYSVADGAAIANKPVVVFQHQNPQSLQDQLKQQLKPGQRPLVFCDGIAPTTGEVAPLKTYRQILGDYTGALLCVDDAHATGVIGRKGQGSFEYCGIDTKDEFTNCYATGTLSKALGGHGGIIAGSHQLIEKIYSHSKIPIASSSVPIPAAAASAKALKVLLAQPEFRQQLWDNVAYAKQAFAGLGFSDIPQTPVPIICLSPSGVDLAGLQQALFKQDLVTHYVPGGSYSSVPDGGAVRVAIFATHSHQQIDRLVDAVKTVI